MTFLNSAATSQTSLPWQTVTAPCKVNLTLDVFPPRPDGFHDLDSLVVKLSPSDIVRVCVRYPVSQNIVLLTCDDPALPTDEKNLAYRAAKLFIADKPQLTVLLELAKKLPYQAGLGSASSDAAAVLSELRRFYDRAKHTEQEAEAYLFAIATAIGSDVPLFLLPGAVRMQGRGDRVEPLAFLVRTLHGVLVKPHVGVPTPTAYRLLDALPNRVPGARTQNLLSVLQSKPEDLTAIADALGNDFEAAILPASPEVAAAHQALTDAGAIRALLCGSGSACFGLAESVEHAEAIAETLRGVPDRFAWVAVAESLP